jgi:hypothetical protein
MFVPLGFLCFLLSLFVVDAGLPDDGPKQDSDANNTQTDVTSDKDSNGPETEPDVPEAIPTAEKGRLETEKKGAEEIIEKNSID